MSESEPRKFQGKYWNYRIMEFIYEDESYFELREVFYDDNDTPIAYTDSAATVAGADLAEIQNGLKLMEAALSKDILKESDFLK